MDSIKYLFISVMVTVLSGSIIIGCSRQQSPQAEVYVPKKWASGECIHELRVTWIVSLTKCGVDTGSDEQMRGLVRRVWEAERDGKTEAQLDEAFNTRTAKDIIDNGI